MDFTQKLRSARLRHWIGVLLLAVALATVWITRGEAKSSQTGISVLYIAMLVSGFAIWYGYNNYDKTAEILKPKSNDEEKEVNYLKATSFQGILIFGAGVLNLLLWIIFGMDQFGYTSAVSLIFMLVLAPSQSKFENDFYEPVYLDEEMKESPEDENK